MPKQSTTRSYDGQDFFVGNDVHLKSWTITVRTLGMEVETFTMPPSPDTLVKHLRGKYPGGSYHAVYEAGFCGFSAHRRLVELGIDPKIPPVELLSDEFIEHVREHSGGNPEAKASEMEHAIRKHCTVHLEEDPAFYKRLTEKHERIAVEIVKLAEKRHEELIK